MGKVIIKLSFFFKKKNLLSKRKSKVFHLHFVCNPSLYQYHNLLDVHLSKIKLYIKLELTIIDLIHVDIWIPMSFPSASGHRYFLTIVDDHTRFTWIFFMKSKSETAALLKQFIILVENQFTKTVKVVRTNNGLEFKIDSFYASKGIEHQNTC